MRVMHTGTLGVIAAHEGDNYYSFNKHGIELGVVANKTYAGTPRVYAPAIRTVISRHEKRFTLQVRSDSYIYYIILYQCGLARVALVLSASWYWSQLWCPGGGALCCATDGRDLGSHWRTWVAESLHGCRARPKNWSDSLANLFGVSADATS